MYNLIENNETYLKTLGSLWQCYRDKPALNANGVITDFPNNNNNSASLKFKQQMRRQTGNAGTKHVELVIPLKYRSNFWRTLEMRLILKLFLS